MKTSVMGKFIAGMALVGCGVSFGAISASEVVTLPADKNYGGGDLVGSPLVAATYNGGNGPGVWIVADGGYRLYHNGALLAEENQAGRVRFIPMTLLPGENAFSVVGVNGKDAPGVMVQIDDLDRSYYSGSDWKAKPAVGSADWKNKGRDLSMWGNATVLKYENTKMPSGGALNGFAPNTQSKWIWSGSESDKNAVLLFTLNIKAEGFGAVTTGGDKGEIVIATDSAEITKHLKSDKAVTILVPEGTYDFRQFRNAATEANSKGRTWCRKSCDEKNAITGKTNVFYRIAFEKNSCASLGESGLQIVQESENLQKWDNWITIRGNKSLIGMGRGANLRGASLNNRHNEGGHNNIYRNLAIYDVNPHLIEAGDGLETSGDKNTHIKNFWADHISYKWISDGFDMEFVDNATISYLDFDGANEYNCWGTDPFMSLVEDAHLTFANNYWHNTNGRVPKVTGETAGSQVHLYNQFVDGNRFFIAGANGHSANAKAYVRYENSYFKNGKGYLAEWGDNGYVYFSGITFDNTKKEHRYNSKVTSGVPAAQTFNPSYSWEKRDVARLPSDIPTLSGVGGRFGKMPSYNQAFGMSPKAATVTINSPLANEKFDAGSSVLLSAAKKSGSVKSVAFYIGNELVGTATAEPYSVTASGLGAGVYSAVAVVTDNYGLTQMSEFVTFEIAEESVPEIPESSSSAVDESSSSSGGIEPPEESSSSSAPDSSDDAESSSSEGSTLIYPMASIATEAEAGFYRIFDMQGRPLYAGETKPNKMPAARVVVVEFTKSGTLKRRYIQAR